MKRIKKIALLSLLTLALAASVACANHTTRRDVVVEERNDRVTEEIVTPRTPSRNQPEPGVTDRAREVRPDAEVTPVIPPAPPVTPIVPDTNNGVPNNRTEQTTRDDGTVVRTSAELNSSENSSSAEAIADIETASEDTDNQSSASDAGFDYAEFASLSSEKMGWGPGVIQDSNGQPVGATDYQQKFGKYNAVFVAPYSNNVYLTFDEGYENGFTASILDTLREKDVKSIFFITYDYAKRNPELVQRMIDEGHVVGNHSTSHPSFPAVTLQEVREEILTLHDYIEENFGYTMNLCRPPMGEFSEQTLAVTQALGYQSVFWSFAYMDYDVDNQPDPNLAKAKIMDTAHGGEILLLHAVSETNAEILPEIIDEFQKRNFTFVIPAA